MATFSTSLNLVDIITVSKSYNTSTGVNEVIYTVPAGYYASINLIGASYWDAISITANRTVNSIDVVIDTYLSLLSGELTFTSTAANIVTPQQISNCLITGDFVELSGNGSSSNPSTADILIYLFKKP